MLNGRNLVVDSFSEVVDLLEPWTTHQFWNFLEHDVVPNSVYVVARKTFTDHAELIKKTLMSRSDIIVFFDNAAEGSWTLVTQLEYLNLLEYAKSKKLLLIGGGDMDDSFSHVRYDHFLVEILNYEKNIQATASTSKIFEIAEKPYKFLFLNGRARPHRKYLYEQLRISGLLDSALWSMLDIRPTISRHFHIKHNGANLMAQQSELKLLPSKYEVEQYRENISSVSLDHTESFAKYKLFNNEWGEIYIQPEQYVDTYFSLITETVFEYPYSFRTEKLARPLLIGHPWIVAGSVGYYRDLRNLGFKTFSHVIDESFDEVANHQDRMNRIFDIVSGLCNDNLASFLAACKETCKYNQQHIQSLAPVIKQQFVDQFFQVLKNHNE